MLERITEDKELIKALRCDYERNCWEEKCPYLESSSYNDCNTKRKEHDAADAIEELISRVPKWISVKDRVPEQTGLYNVYLQEATSWVEQGMEASYVTTMWFDKKQMLWVDGDDSYNAVLSAVNTNEIHHVTHWCELPEPPKGE